jgi:hypothetical protein
MGIFLNVIIPAIKSNSVAKNIKYLFFNENAIMPPMIFFIFYVLFAPIP